MLRICFFFRSHAKNNKRNIFNDSSFVCEISPQMMKEKSKGENSTTTKEKSLRCQWNGNRLFRCDCDDADDHRRFEMQTYENILGNLA